MSAHRADIEKLSNGKIRCTVTGHEMPRDLIALRAHWSGKRFKRAKAAAAAGPVDLSAHAPWIVPHRKNPRMCYCRLTKDTINMTKEDVAKHVAGRRYKKKLAEKLERKRRYQAKQDRRDQKRREWEARQRAVEGDGDGGGEKVGGSGVGGGDCSPDEMFTPFWRDDKEEKAGGFEKVAPGGDTAVGRVSAAMSDNGADDDAYRRAFRKGKTSAGAGGKPDQGRAKLGAKKSKAPIQRGKKRRSAEARVSTKAKRKRKGKGVAAKRRGD